MKLFKLNPNRGQRRRIVKGNLRNVDVDLISLLFDEVKPANMRGAVIKSADGKRGTILGATAKFKAETVGSEGLLYVTVMEPDVVDSQGDTYTAEEVKKAAHHFAKKGMVGKNDINHNNQPVPEFVIAESYLLKAEDKEHFPNTKVGAWVQVLKCENIKSELWQKVQEGAFNGVSIAGFAEDTAAAGNGALVAELKSQLEGIRKAVGSNPSPDTNKVLGTIQSRIHELEQEDSTSAHTELIKAFTNEIKELNVSITKAISKSLKGEPGEQGGDSEVMIDGKKIIVKSAHREIYKGIADVDSGSAMNILTPNTTSLFIDEVIGSQPGETLSDITVVPLLKDEKIDAGLINDLVFNNSLDAAESAQAIGSKDISCPTGILNAEFTLGRDVVEFYKDKYGEDAFGAYVEQHIAKKAEKAIRLLLFKGDRASGTAALKALNGVIKLAINRHPKLQIVLTWTNGDKALCGEEI
ncbi:MAG: XkdF-like putative serine protease domain-containing protein [Candidatus Cloacimonetes bacterium]|nr:XkdF-like putative serine protease domain-containing protein [Candidatus Cloacimonadota bacterium]MCB5279582.1 XkdF-like putative serine protease domain-containing protein [Candidatus Cloacimonadota bacterium]MCK9185585.1 XkdF-like putative serine protease domain-containing protein [Candidatus Cloacimonadota bacterium]